MDRNHPYPRYGDCAPSDYDAWKGVPAVGQKQYPMYMNFPPYHPCPPPFRHNFVMRGRPSRRRGCYWPPQHFNYDPRNMRPYPPVCPCHGRQYHPSHPAQYAHPGWAKSSNEHALASPKDVAEMSKVAGGSFELLGSGDIPDVKKGSDVADSDSLSNEQVISSNISENVTEDGFPTHSFSFEEPNNVTSTEETNMNASSMQSSPNSNEYFEGSQASLNENRLILPDETVSAVHSLQNVWPSITVSPELEAFYNQCFPNENNEANYDNVAIKCLPSDSLEENIGNESNYAKKEITENNLGKEYSLNAEFENACRELLSNESLIFSDPQQNATNFAASDDVNGTSENGAFESFSLSPTSQPQPNHNDYLRSIPISAPVQSLDSPSFHNNLYNGGWSNFENEMTSSSIPNGMISQHSYVDPMNCELKYNPELSPFSEFPSNLTKIPKSLACVDPKVVFKKQAKRQRGAKKTPRKAKTPKKNQNLSCAKGLDETMLKAIDEAMNNELSKRFHKSFRDASTGTRPVDCRDSQTQVEEFQNVPECPEVGTQTEGETADAETQWETDKQNAGGTTSADHEMKENDPFASLAHFLNTDIATPEGENERVDILNVSTTILNSFSFYMRKIFKTQSATQKMSHKTCKGKKSKKISKHPSPETQHIFFRYPSKAACKTMQKTSKESKSEKRPETQILLAKSNLNDDLSIIDETGLLTEWKEEIHDFEQFFPKRITRSGKHN